MRFIVVAVLAIAAACGRSGDSTPAPAVTKVDASYGDGGKVAHPATAVGGVAVARDGSAFVFGTAITKYDPAGNLDASFGAAGRVELSGFASHAQIDPAGNIHLIVDGALVRLDTRGTAVTVFGRDALAAAGLGEIRAFVRSGDDRFYLVGSLPGQLAVGRVDAAGQLVASFGAGGRVTFDSLGAEGFGAAVDDAGNLHVSGEVWGAFSKFPVVWKLDSFGRPESSFGVNGIWRGAVCSAFMHAGGPPIAVAPGGDLVLATNCDSHDSGVTARVAVFKIDRAGNTLNAFRDGGLRAGLFGTGPIGGTPALMLAMVVAPNGYIYLAAIERIFGLASCSRFALASLDANGNPVTSFGDGGVMSFPARDVFRVHLGMDGTGRLYSGMVGEWSCALGGVFRDSPLRSGLDIYRLVP